MQERELYINGNLIELSDITRIGVTYQANNLGELQNRQGTFTNTFKVPVTDSNMVALEFANLMTSNTDVPYRKNTGTYKEFGIDLVSDGEAILKMSELGFYLIDIIGGNMDMSRAIGDLIVGELYASDTVYLWNLQNAFDSRDGSQYFIYPLVDWRIDIDTFFTTTQADARQMLPCATMPSLFSRLESTIGFDFTGAYLDSDEHNNMILTPSDFSKNPEYFDEEELKSERLLSNGFINVDAPKGSNVISNQEAVIFDTYPIGFDTTSYYPAVNEVSNLTFAASFIGTYSYTPASGFINTNIYQYFYFVAQIKNNSGAVLAEYTSEIINSRINNDVYTNEPMTPFSISTGEINLLASEGYFCSVILYLHGHPDLDTSFTVRYKNNIFFSVLPSLSLVFGNEIKFRDLFRMKVSDVLKDILNLRGVIIQTNSYTKQVQFNYFQDLIDNKPNAKDWSDKIDVRQMQTEYKFGKYNQRNWFRFKENEDVTNELGDYYFDIDDQTLEAEGDAVKMNHPATEEENRYLGYNIPTIEGIDSLNKWQKPKWRILQIDRQNTSFNVDFIDGTSTLTATTEIPVTEFIGFEELVPEFYQVLIDILARTKSIILPVKLTAVEISELDFTIPIFLSITELDISDYFYINQISNYKSGFTPVQFIRL